MAILNPTVLRWTDPTTRVDGSAFAAEAFRAYELGVSPDGDLANVVPVLALPTAYGVGQSPIPTAVADARHTIQWVHLRTQDVLNQTSVWTPGVEVLFSSPPLAPAAFSVA